jgi:hypothetical protein
MPDRAKHIRGFLGRSDAVNALLQEIRRREDVIALVRRLLPPAIAGHCRQATIDNGHLALFVDSPVWVDRLRFVSPQLIDALNTQGAVEVTDCRVRVLPESAGPSPSASSPAVGASHESIACLQRAADDIADRSLSESLRRLANSLDSME